ncbi:MAG TPA: SCO family protein [Blastocatellia bacterium]|nr:SCO family protein [Blastocatellia bacterium]
MLDRRLKTTAARVLILLTASCSFQLITVSRAETRQSKQPAYVCPMHPDVKSARPSRCPKCGMELRAAAGSEKPVEARAAESLQIPDANVVDQDGRRLRFYTDLVKGKTVAINFIFTTCTTICPPLTATFRKVQQQMGDRVGRDVSLISVSVDPTTDVPERLAAFSAKFNRGEGWSFVTGTKPEIDRLLRALGAYAGDKNDHTPMILIGNDGAGYWTRTYGLSPPATLAKAITEAADKSRTAQASDQKKAASPAEAAARYFPNTVLLTQDNKPVHFFDDLLKGKTVLINFVFTTCAGVCPPMTANLAKVQEYLGDRVGRDINMITISVDPVIDTPAEMKKYAEKFKTRPGWYFLTGKKEDVDQVLRKVGGYVEDKNQHVSLLLVGNVETGEWSKVFAMSKPSDIADAALRIAGPARQ